jgi:hypothetical protein
MQGELANARAFFKVDLVEPDPYKARTQGVLEKVDFVLMVRHSTPNGGGDVRLARRADAARDADVAHDAEDGSDRRARVARLFNRVYIKTGAGKAVGGAVGARQHDGAANLLPVLIKCNLLAVNR